MKRRQFLRSSASILALPMLSSALPRSAWAADPDGPPLRMIFWYVPNGIVMNHWTPTSSGEEYDLPQILAPLAPVQSDVSVITGLGNQAAVVSQAGDHARGTGSFLTCETVFFTSGADIYNGISVDQVYAQAIGSQTPFPSLELGMEGGSSSGSCDSGYPCAYPRNISWASPTTPMPKITNPRTAFNRIFASFDPTITQEELDRKKEQRLSILDFVLEDIQQLNGRLGNKDRLKLDEYLTAVRQLETRLTTLNEGECLPGEGPESGVTFQQSVAFMNEIMVLALQCDMTRVATFMLGNGGSNRTYGFIGVPGAHHEMSHHGNDSDKLTDLAVIDTWEVGQFANLVEQLGAVQEEDGSRLLDNTLACFSSEIEDGNTHRHHNLPVLLAGGGRGAHRAGRHINVAENTPIANLYLSMLQAGGVETETFGSDGTSVLPELL